MSSEDKPKMGSSQPNYDLRRIFDTYIEETFKSVDKMFEIDSFPIEMLETDSDVIIEARLDGYNREQIAIEVEGNLVHINVIDEKIIEEKDDNRHFYRKETSFTQLGRTITLPFDVSKKHTNAELQNGVLTIVIPK